MKNMNTIILTNDGKLYVGRSQRHAVEQMRDSGIFTIGKTNEQYMISVASRAKLLDHVDVSASNEHDFLCDLEKHKLISRLFLG